MDASGCDKIILEDEYLEADDITPACQKESKFWMNFNAYDANITSSNFYVGKTRPKDSEVSPYWYNQSIELPEGSVEVPPLETAFKEFMDIKISSSKLIPPLEAKDMGLKLHAVPTRTFGTNTEGVRTGGIMTVPATQAPPPAPSPPQHPPTVPQHQEETVQMEAEPAVPKRQLSGGSQMAVRQAPRPMPSPQGEIFQCGGSAIEYAKTHFTALGPPAKGDEHRSAYLEQLQPNTNALTVLAMTGTIQ